MTFPVLILRLIRTDDNAPLAAIIRATLAAVGLDRPGTVHSAPSTDHLHELFQCRSSAYVVVERAGRVLDGAGSCVVRSWRGLADSAMAGVYLALRGYFLL